MAMQLVLGGFEELKRAIREIPMELRDEGKVIFRETGEEMAAELRSIYPAGPLREGVKITEKENPVSIAVTVRSTARTKSRQDLAAMWEFGTQNRTTQKGWKRGAGPAHPDRGVISLAQKHRRAMWPRFIPILQRLGFTVEVSAD